MASVKVVPSDGDSYSFQQVHDTSDVVTLLPVSKTTMRFAMVFRLTSILQIVLGVTLIVLDLIGYIGFGALYGNNNLIDLTAVLRVSVEVLAILAGAVDLWMPHHSIANFRRDFRNIVSLLADVVFLSALVMTLMISKLMKRLEDGQGCASNCVHEQNTCIALSHTEFELRVTAIVSAGVLMVVSIVKTAVGSITIARGKTLLGQSPRPKNSKARNSWTTGM